jgi:flagellar biosynthesis/type III secretory pathway protein FliH
LSEVRGKVDHLMETTNTENHTESTSSQPARYAELQALVASMAADFQKFYQDGNKAAGTRVRNAMQELKTLAQAIRTEVQSIKNGGAPGAPDSDSDSEAS